MAPVKKSNAALSLETKLSLIIDAGDPALEVLKHRDELNSVSGPGILPFETSWSTNMSSDAALRWTCQLLSPPLKSFDVVLVILL